MIPEFPASKPLSLSDQPDVERVTRRFVPYSDFNFVSMYSWDVEEAVRLSSLNDNLVVHFCDYLTSEPFFMFMGERDVNATAARLIAHSECLGLPSELRLIPACVAARLDQAAFCVAEIPDHADYVVSVRKLVAYEGQELALQRNFRRRFLCKHGNITFALLDLSDGTVTDAIEALYERWHLARNGCAASVDEHEKRAIIRCCGAFGANLIATGLFAGDALVAFWLGENVGAGYALSHFEKAETTEFIGIVPYLRQRTAEILSAQGIEFINLEQDLGFPGLRQSKRSYAPVAYLKKYRVTRR